MPMAEVFTISGAHVAPDPTPAGGYPAPVLLQNALKSLGDMAGDPKLSNLIVDGVVGSNTVKAVNYALANYVGATKYFPQANLTLPKVRQYAGGLAQIVSDHVKAHGGTVQAPVVHHRSSGGGGAVHTAADILTPPPSTGFSSRTIFLIAGGAALVIALGFMVAHKKRSAA